MRYSHRWGCRHLLGIRRDRSKTPFRCGCMPSGEHLCLAGTHRSFLHDSVREESIAGSPGSGVEDTSIYDELMKRAQVVCCPFTAPVLVTIMPSFSGLVGS